LHQDAGTGQQPLFGSLSIAEKDVLNNEEIQLGKGISNKVGVRIDLHNTSVARLDRN